MGFTKLDEGILKSSIMAESPETFKVWIALLASCGPDGVSRVSSVYLSSVCHFSPDITDRSIEILSSPDSRSRSSVEDGRRIKKIDGGYFIFNYEKYRSFMYSDNPESIRKRLYRKRKNKRGVSGHSRTCPGHSASASSSGSSFSSLKKEESEGEGFEKFWKVYPKKAEKQVARRTWNRLMKTAKAEEVISAAGAYAAFLAERGEVRFVKNAATFLNEDRWRDWLPGSEAEKDAAGAPLRGIAEWLKEHEEAKDDEML